MDLDETIGYNQLKIRRCKELDGKYLSIILTIIITPMIGYFTYSEYRMLQMDKLSQSYEINGEKDEIIDKPTNSQAKKS